MSVHICKTDVLKLAYEQSGPAKGDPVLLVHGWPDSPRTWDKVLPELHANGYRTIVPYLRGYGRSKLRTHLLRKNPRHTGQVVAFVQDIIDLADHLGLRTFHFVGHDWGARTGYGLAALFAERLKSIVAISVPFEPGRAEPPELPQARAFWYQWFLCSIPGCEKFIEDPVAFGRMQWDTWSPKGWYTEAEFQEVADSWKGEQFTDVVLHSYRSRWGHARLDPHYQALQAKYEATRTLATPALLIHGAEDHCELLETTDGADRYFSNEYWRLILNGVGHFPQRENPVDTTRAIVAHLQRH